MTYPNLDESHTKHDPSSKSFKGAYFRVVESRPSSGNGEDLVSLWHEVIYRLFEG